MGAGDPHQQHDHPKDSHGHSHGPSLARASDRHRRPLLLAFGVIAVFFVVELVAGIVINSLALLSDAGHMFTDVLGLGMALAAMQLASRFTPGQRTSGHTFGLYRLEILAAFVNALLLFGVAIWVVIEAVRRLFDEAEVASGAMIVVAVVGLAANVVAFLLLREGADESLNLKAAYLEVVADGVGSVGVIVAAVLIDRFGWLWADPLIAAAIGLWILPRTWRLGAQAVRVLLQSAPAHLDLERLATKLGAISGVVDVHDLHVWTLTSEMEAASAHLMTTDDADTHAVLDQARSLLADEFGIDHGTFQVEPASHQGCYDLAW